MAQIFTSHLAKRDIQDIWIFLADKSIETADDFVIEFSRISTILALNPASGRSCHNLINGLRRFSFRQYMIYYFPVRDGIEIYRVIHTARDIEGLFEDYFENL